MKKLAMTLILTLLIAAPAVPQTTDDNLPQLIEAAVPKDVGNPDIMRRLLNPMLGPQLSRSFQAKNLEKAVDDKLPPDPCCKDSLECTIQNDRGSALRIDLTRGKVRYSNLERSRNKQATSQPPDPAIEMARRTAAAIGIPQAELSKPDFRYLRVTGANAQQRDTRGMSFRAEGHVRFSRQIGGFPVAFSKFFAAVDSKGQIARAYARWPDFALTPGLRLEQMLSRQQVVMSILEELRPALRPGTTRRIVANIVYAPVNLLDVGETTDEQPPDPALPPDPDHAISFSPALLVTVVPVEQPENSGIPQMPAQNLVFPLLQGGGDESAPR